LRPGQANQRGMTLDLLGRTISWHTAFLALSGPMAKHRQMMQVDYRWGDTTCQLGTAFFRRSHLAGFREESESAREAQRHGLK